MDLHLEMINIRCSEKIDFLENVFLALPGSKFESQTIAAANELNCAGLHEAGISEYLIASDWRFERLC
jgi:hypothetical protein